MTKQKIIHWFRQDLRLADNPSLLFACESGQVIPVYIFDEINSGKFSEGQASKTWLHESLILLNQSLSGKLLLLEGNPNQILSKLALDNNVSFVTWNRCYAPWQIKRDTDIKKTLIDQGIDCKSFNGSLLWEPWEILKNDGTPYKVFTPFYRKGCLGSGPPREPLPKPREISYVEDIICHQTINTKSYSTKNWQDKILGHAAIGEEKAAETKLAFLNSGISNYKNGRNFPNAENVSRLAPNLHFGEISPNQIWSEVKTLPPDENTDHFLSELGWREFSNYLLYHFPKITNQNLQSKFDSFPWINNKSHLKKWQTGQTGIPMVDAGMRELWQTGSMHNRSRMIVGSFLVKNLLIDWRYGASWFWDCLFDADIANNTAGWQWIAGCGADAAPYFRIFNPITQGEKFDPDGAYIKKYIPELEKLGLQDLFCPWEASEKSLKDAGVILGENYPLPIVSLKESRQTALEAFNSLKK